MSFLCRRVIGRSFPGLLGFGMTLGFLELFQYILLKMLLCLGGRVLSSFFFKDRVFPGSGFQPGNSCQGLLHSGGHTRYYNGNFYGFGGALCCSRGSTCSSRRSMERSGFPFLLLPGSAHPRGNRRSSHALETIEAQWVLNVFA